jgi:membrane-associated phospholipid phosphatase
MHKVPGWLRFSAVAAVLVLGSFALDGWAYDHLVYARVYDEDWGRLLRVQGFWPLWLLAATALVLNDWPARAAGRLYPALMRGFLLLASASAAGILGEILKLLFRRERPRAHDGEYFFRAFTERPFSTSGLAMPSSHTIVAFGAACMLARLFPRAWPIWFLLATGCGLTRVLLALAHAAAQPTGSIGFRRLSRNAGTLSASSPRARTLLVASPMKADTRNAMEPSSAAPVVHG